MSILEVRDSKVKEELLPAFKGTLPGHKIILMKETLKKTASTEIS